MTAPACNTGADVISTISACTTRSIRKFKTSARPRPPTVAPAPDNRNRPSPCSVIAMRLMEFAFSRRRTEPSSPSTSCSSEPGYRRSIHWSPKARDLCPDARCPGADSSLCATELTAAFVNPEEPICRSGPGRVRGSVRGTPRRERGRRCCGGSRRASRNSRGGRRGLCMSRHDHRVQNRLGPLARQHQHSHDTSDRDNDLSSIHFLFHAVLPPKRLIRLPQKHETRLLLRTQLDRFMVSLAATTGNDDWRRTPPP
jgi:hypothetical protein